MKILHFHLTGASRPITVPLCLGLDAPVTQARHRLMFRQPGTNRSVAKSATRERYACLFPEASTFARHTAAFQAAVFILDADEMGIFTSLKNWWNHLWIDEGPGSIEELRKRLNRPSLRLFPFFWAPSPRYKLKGPDDILVWYRWHKIPKRGGGTRVLYSPTPKLKELQRLLLRKVFKKLRVHSAAMGFVKDKSIVTHAKMHVGQSVVVRIDIKDFFPCTSGERVRDYFRRIGWNKKATEMLMKACTKYHRRKHRSGLPQGAPTSPILSNLVNYRMDARLAGLAKKSGAIYSRYADDIIFSFAKDDRRFIRGVIRRVRKILWENGYRMHGKAKLRIMRRHQRQIVTGLVVNDKVQLPRKTRRWLRAVEHHVRTNRPITLTPAQLQGWRALQNMVQKQRVEPRP